MASQGFFSGSESAEKRRFAGEKENNAAFSVKVKPVTIANNINKYNEQTPSLDYAPDRVGEYIKKAEEKNTYQKKIEERNRIAESFGIDPKTGPTYTERDESKFGGELLKSPFPGVKDRYITTKERISGITDPRYAKESGFTVTPTKFDKGTAFQIGVQFDKNKYGLTPAKVLGVDIGGMYNFKDPKYGESTKAFVAGMMQNQADAMQTEARLKKEQEEKKEQAKIDAANERFDKISKDFLNDPEFKNRIYQKTTETESPAKEETSTVDKVFGFLDAIGKVERVDPQVGQTGYTAEDTPKLGTMPSMGISEAGREEAKQNRLEKAKQEANVNVQENKNIIQRVGDFVGDTFNRLTGTEAAGAGTLQSQGINTNATVNIAQMGNVSPSVQKSRDAVARSNLRRSGLNRTVGGQSSQANYGRSRKGFGTGTHGKGMPSNPKGMRQQGVGVSANNLSRHSVGHSSTQPKGNQGNQGGNQGGDGGDGGDSTNQNQGLNRSLSRRRGRGGSKGGGKSSGGGGGGSPGGGSPGGGGGMNRSRKRRRCDVRCKIDISPLINSNLVKDDLAKVAYFVQEIK